MNEVMSFLIECFEYLDENKGKWSQSSLMSNSLIWILKAKWYDLNSTLGRCIDFMQPMGKNSKWDTFFLFHSFRTQAYICHNLSQGTLGILKDPIG